MRKDKGRRPLEELVHIRTAARMLDVSVRTLHRMCTRGVLQPTYKTSRGPKYFPLPEIAALAEVLGRDVSLADVSITATRALATARANERRLDDLTRIMGLKRKVLDTRLGDVASLYEQVVEALTLERQPEFDELEDWSGTFYAVDEAYLALVVQVTGSLEPWKPFLDLANKMANDRPFAFFDSIPTLRVAYDYLEASRRNLRIVSYMYCRERQGVTTANKLFGKGDLSDQILSVMFTV